MLLDDHEIDDNWEPVSDPDEEQNQIDMKLGVAAFEKYQRGSALKLEDFRFDGFDSSCSTREPSARIAKLVVLPMRTW